MQILYWEVTPIKERERKQNWAGVVVPLQFKPDKLFANSMGSLLAEFHLAQSWALVQSQTENHPLSLKAEANNQWPHRLSQRLSANQRSFWVGSRYFPEGRSKQHNSMSVTFLSKILMRCILSSGFKIFWFQFHDVSGLQIRFFP